MVLPLERPYLVRAIELSREHAMRGDGGPFGALVVDAEGIVAEGWNEVVSTLDPTAHAEVVAIRRAAQKRERFSLRGCVMYASCEPCPMCFAAIHWARLDAIYYAASREDAASIGFDDALLYKELALEPSARSMALEQSAQDQDAAVAAMRAWWWWPKKVSY